MNYDQASDRIQLSWTAPSADVACYRIYRTTSLDRHDQPDTTMFTYVQVPASVTSYSDIPAPSIAVYYYGVRSVRVEGGDTVEGVLTPPWPGLKSCQVGVPVRFTISRGDVFVATPACSVFIEDPTAMLSAVRFTQITRIDSIDSAGAWHALPPAAAVVDPKDPHRQIASLVKSGFVVAVAESTVLVQNTRRRKVPLFDSADALNPVASYPLSGGGTVGFGWVLTQGSGQKTVYAEVTYGSGRKDTLVDLIATKPHRVELTTRNLPLGYGVEGGPDYYTKDTTRSRKGPSGTLVSSIKIFYFPRPKFSVKTFNDTTINNAIEYWLLTAADNEDIDPTIMKDKTYQWLMTEPVPQTLQPGAADQVFTYDLDPSTDGGRAALQRLRVCKALKTDTVLTAPPDTLYALLTNLRTYAQDFNTAALTTEGRKEFILVTRFTEKFFGDTFVSVMGYTDTAEDYSTYLDVYSPVAEFITTKKSPDYLDSNSIITAPFSFAMRDSASLTDGGFAKITAVSLVIAKKPATLKVSSANARKILTPGMLMSMRNNVYPYPINTPTSQIFFVRWDNINPLDWPSGKYIMAIVTEDEYGRRYFPNVSSETKLVNPWIVEVRTGG